MPAENKNTFIILGLLSHEPMTGYEIKSRIDRELSFFWSAGYGSIYPALTALQKNGFAAASKATANNREKIIYTITEKGEKHLCEWLKCPTKRDELKYETLVKLFFSSEIGDSEAIKHIERFEEKIKSELPVLLKYEEILKNAEPHDKHKYFLLTVMFGIETYKGYLSWCKKAKAMLTLKK